MTSAYLDVPIHVDLINIYLCLRILLEVKLHSVDNLPTVLSNSIRGMYRNPNLFQGMLLLCLALEIECPSDTSQLFLESRLADCANIGSIEILKEGLYIELVNIGFVRTTDNVLSAASFSLPESREVAEMRASSASAALETSEASSAVTAIILRMPLAIPPSSVMTMFLITPVVATCLETKDH